ncbi:hypothetical protein LMH87_006514 [Akanthomyces muscarius]|uniref:Uncharacterized protein n=1 Tax=Akanthomyces muscarius TaxID=2231603 RepID=A0A9W8UT85_AKAMU|nr:hypothetical protein LMH87_006514 [Akanthomyces muscarius]KAJ4164859.1 hypothetical protein LMH87_006514 [Akanthomyces muscarius]
MSSRRRQITVEDSWRMVDGENDSFDTSLLPGATPEDDNDDILSPLSSEQPSSGVPSQQQHQQRSSQSQPNSSFGSQDSIRDFVKHQADDNVILREPFRPSIPSSVVGSSSLNSLRQAHSHRTPDPEFRMPTLDVGSDRRGSGQSSRTIRPGSSPRGAGDSTVVRRRGYASQDTTPVKRRSARQRSDYDEYEAHRRDRRDDASSIPSLSSGIARWAAAVVGLAFQYAKRPLALLLAVYLSCGAIIITQNMLQRSIYVSLSPICRVPGASLLNLPFCTDTRFGGDKPEMPTSPVEFDDLMGVQAKFEDVLEKSVDGASLPLEMKRSEASLRDLRTLVKHSDIQARDELMFEFDGFIDTARQSAADLQRFNTHVGSAVDAVITINRWTARYIDSLAPLSSDGAISSSTAALTTWSGWLFSPFQPAEQVFSERILRDKYVEHTTLVSERIAALILEAQAILRLLTIAEDHLSLIYEVSSRSAATLSSRRDEILWNVWTLVGGNARRLSNLSQQLTLLRRVDAQRSTAVMQVSALVLELEAIQAGLGDLRDRVAEPGVLRDAESAKVATLPLTIHIETIDRGVERLEAARRRIRAAEDDRVREVLAKGGVRDDQDRLIGDSPRS